MSIKLKWMKLIKTTNEKNIDIDRVDNIKIEDMEVEHYKYSKEELKKKREDDFIFLIFLCLILFIYLIEEFGIK